MEEIPQGYLTAALDRYIMAESSRWETRKKALEAQGLSPEEAEKQLWNELNYDAIPERKAGIMICIICPIGGRANDETHSEGQSFAGRTGVHKRQKMKEEMQRLIEILKEGGGEDHSEYDIDHWIDLQLGGADEASNMHWLDRSVNRSLGAQIQQYLSAFEEGTVFGTFTID